MRQCIQCGAQKALTEFEGGRNTCRKCRSKAKAKWNKLNPPSTQKRRNYWIKHAYSITQAEYDTILQRQGGVCAICGEPPDGLVLDIDHDHTTGAIRGLLHRRCNTALGIYEKTKPLHSRIEEYLQHGTSNQ